MEIIKQSKEYTIYKKRNGRHAVQVKKSNKKVWINGEEKVQILLKEGLIKLSEARPAEEAPAEESEAATEENSEGEGEGEGE